MYGGNTKMPFSEHDSINHPLSLYAASKKQMNYWHIHIVVFTITNNRSRFFTVYGPWGRPDMALFKFTKVILDEKPIDVFNNGKHLRFYIYRRHCRRYNKTIEKPATSM